MPGKYKRILLAIARRAKNDGTNMYASKETLADLAGVSRWTVYRHLPDLLEVGVLLEATEHTCGNNQCDKKDKHFCGCGHYTVAYNLNVAVLQNATQLVSSLCSKMPKVQCSKMPKSHVAKCDAMQGYKDKPAPLGASDESSASDEAVVSKQVSEGEVPPAKAEDNATPLTSEEEALLEEIMPVVRDGGLAHKKRLAIILKFTDSIGVNAIELLRYNRVHKRGALVIRTPERYVTALLGNAEGTCALVNEYILWRDAAQRPKDPNLPAYRRESGKESILKSDI
jgi:hypothetical protein